jgi:hypothetical protein
MTQPNHNPEFASREAQMKAWSRMTDLLSAHPGALQRFSIMPGMASNRVDIEAAWHFHTPSPDESSRRQLYTVVGARAVDLNSVRKRSELGQLLTANDVLNFVARPGATETLPRDIAPRRLLGLPRPRLFFGDRYPAALRTEVATILPRHLMRLAVEMDVEQIEEGRNGQIGICVAREPMVGQLNHPEIGNNNAADRFSRLNDVVDVLDSLGVVPGQPDEWHSFHHNDDATPVAALAYDRGPDPDSAFYA